MTLDAIRSDFALLDDWEDRYRYVIELGRALPPLPEALRTRGQQGARLRQPGVACERGASAAAGRRSGARISRATATPTSCAASSPSCSRMFQDKTADEIMRRDARALFAELGLKEHLTPQRSNGFFSMVERIRNDAHALAAA